MSKEKLKNIVIEEVKRIDNVKTSKRHEIVIEGFEKSKEIAPRAIINGKLYAIFNSNDYLGLRFNEKVRQAEEEASKKYGSGPGAVRFISGTMKIHKELERELAKFHGREDAIIFSSAFAVNMSVIHCFIEGQSEDSLVEADTLVVSEEFNHRSIINGIKVAGLEKKNMAIFKHLDIAHMKRILEENKGKFKRVVIVTDGVFSMLGEYQDLAKMKNAVSEYENDFEEGIITIVDDSHGVASLGKTGKGCEEVCNAQCDLLVGTMGKGFGVDGGYIVGDKVFIDYLRESAATYIYSNPISPGTTGAALQAVRIVNSEEGKRLLENLNNNIAFFKDGMKKEGWTFGSDSEHAIQPVLVGDPVKARELVGKLFNKGVIVTNISYPVVSKGKDEIRIQISAIHTKKDLDEFIEKMSAAGKKLGLI